MSQRGGFGLKLGDYIYNRRQKARKNRYRWYCANYHRGCKVTLLTTEDWIASECIGEHDHEPPKIVCS